MNMNEALSKLPDTDQNVVSVLSGGLDSTIMTYILVKKYGNNRVFALSYNYGQKQVKELEMAAKTCQHLGIAHKVLDLGIHRPRHCRKVALTCRHCLAGQILLALGRHLACIWAAPGQLLWVVTPIRRHDGHGLRQRPRSASCFV